MKDLITVIIPVYKVEKYLDKCVQSVVEQTYKNLEIILVDDGSPDGCPAKCDEWAKKDSRIKVIHKKNEGVAIARNVGVDEAKGEYIAFVDSDDYIDATMYEKLLNKAKEEDADMTLCRFLEVDENGKTRKFNEVNLTKCNSTNIVNLYVNFKTWEEGDTLCLEAISGSVCRTLYKKSFVGEKRFEGLAYAEDYCFNLSLFIKKPKIAVVDEYLYYYFQRSSSCVHIFDERAFYVRLQASERTLELFRPLLNYELFCAYKFCQCRELLICVVKNSAYKKLIKEYKNIKWLCECNCKENYKQAQKNTKDFKYKFANWLVYKKFYKLFRLLYIIYRS